ncbi:MAG TPA: P-loop NTPase [Smithellaceae bacterium]|nr:P-loop NTPase [Smithellaceae bacterium]
MDMFNIDQFYLKARRHANDPRNTGQIDTFNGYAKITDAHDDTMEFWLLADSGIIQKISFVSTGCDYLLACGSMTTCLAGGKTIEEVRAIDQKSILDALGGLPDDHHHCALLAANTLAAACDDYLSRQEVRQNTEVKGSSACDSCGDTGCSAAKRREGESRKDFLDRRRLQARLCRIKHKIVILSGKGGVGKSMVAVNLAAALMLSGRRVGLLDVDISGPTIPAMLGLENASLKGGSDGLQPVELEGMKIMSSGFLVQNQEEALIWRGPMQRSIIRQFLADVEWGDLDYLIADAPPGTGDELLSFCRLVQPLDGAVIVTTPRKSAADVRRSISFCRQLSIPVLGVVENMSGLICPQCGKITQIFSAGGGKKTAADMNVPFLGAIPLDPAIAHAGDAGQAFIQHFAGSPTARIMQEILDALTTPDCK